MRTITVQLSVTLDDQSIAVLRELVRDVRTDLQAEARLQRSQHAHFGGQKPPEDKGVLIDMKAAAKLLGIGERTVWGLAKEGKMPKPIRIGRAVRWSREELRAWVNHGCPPQAEWEWPLRSEPAS